MPDFIGTLLTTSRRPLAMSAMPDAPVVDDTHHWARPARQVIAAALRGLADHWSRPAAKIALKSEFGR